MPASIRTELLIVVSVWVFPGSWNLFKTLEQKYASKSKQFYQEQYKGTGFRKFAVNLTESPKVLMVVWDFPGWGRREGRCGCCRCSTSDFLFLRICLGLRKLVSIMRFLPHDSCDFNHLACPITHKPKMLNRRFYLDFTQREQSALLRMHPKPALVWLAHFSSF